MRRILAERVFPVTTDAVKDGILCLEDDGTVIGVLRPGEDGYDVSLAEKHTGWLIPGMVNAHCHLELSHVFEAVPEHTGLNGFLEHLMEVPPASEEAILEAMRNADAEMWKNGIVAVGDISNNNRSLKVKAESPIRYFSFIERFGLDPSVAEKSFSAGIDIFNELKQKKRNNVGNLTAHAPYSVSAALLTKICKHIQDVQGIFSIHNQETASENDFFQSGKGIMVERMKKMGIPTASFKPSGKSSLQTLLNTLPAQNNILLVHNTFSEEADIVSAQLYLTKLWWCLCPGANLYIEDKMPPVPLLRQHQCKITLGTDSLASNQQLDLVREMYLIQNAYPETPIEELIRWATLNGAEMLGFDKELGSVCAGKKPGCVLLECIDNKNSLILPKSRARLI